MKNWSIKDLVKKTDYITKITEIENNSPDITDLLKITDYNIKIKEIHYTSRFVTKTNFNTNVKKNENKIPDANFVSKTNILI